MGSGQVFAKTNPLISPFQVYINSRVKYNVPELQMVDFSTIDVILLSNFYNLWALPYITEYTGFKGKIYATEPTIQLGRFDHILTLTFVDHF